MRRNIVVLIAFLLVLIGNGCGLSHSDNSSDGRLDYNNPKEQFTDVSKDAGDFRVLAYNVRHCRGMDDVIDYDRIADIIIAADADFVCLQELDNGTTRSDKAEQIAILAEKTGMFGYFGKAISFQGGEYGNGILSKQEALNTYNYPLPGNEARAVLIAEYDDFLVMSVHLDLVEENRYASFQILTDKAKSLGKRAILAGDINESDLSGKVFLEINKHWDLVSEISNTFPTGNPVKCIDFIFDLKVDQSRSEVTKSSVVYKLPGLDVSAASDHYPLFSDFVK